jgi:mannose-6-phosphate isomerase-like protein (cupin superfamily)
MIWRGSILIWNIAFAAGLIGLLAGSVAHAEDGVVTSTEATRTATMKAAGPGVATTPLPTGPGAVALAAIRTRTGDVELHENFSDLLIIQHGVTRLLVGGHIEGNAQVSPGEWRGGTIVGGSSITLKSGETAWIPPKTPHQMVIEPGSPLTYFAIKYPAHAAD